MHASRALLIRLATERAERIDPQTGRPRFDLTRDEAAASARQAMRLAGAEPGAVRGGGRGR